MTRARVEEIWTSADEMGPCASIAPFSVVTSRVSGKQVILLVRLDLYVTLSTYVCKLFLNLSDLSLILCYMTGDALF